MLYYNQLIIGSFCIYFLGVIFGSLTYKEPTRPEINSKTDFNAWSFTTKEEVFVEIVKNNLKVVAINLSGVTTFCVVSAISTFYNGFILGRLVSYSFWRFGLIAIFESLLPHISEVFAIILSCALSFSAGIDIVRHLKDTRLIFPFRFYITQAAICVSIIFLSALIETYISIGEI